MVSWLMRVGLFLKSMLAMALSRGVKGLDPSLTGTRIRQRVLAGEHAVIIVHVEILKVTPDILQLAESEIVSSSRFSRTDKAQVGHMSY